MSSADELYQAARSDVQHLGLREVPFSESPTGVNSETLQRVFTGRKDELRQVFRLFQSRERRRILVYGHIGIGKSAFLLEVLGVLRRQEPDMLTAFTTLPPDLDLATAAFIALALEMPDDEWAQRQLYQLGMPTEKLLKERSAEISGSLGIGGKIAEKDLPTIQPQYPTFSFNALLDRALERYPRGIVIAIDDLDKRDPDQVQKLLHDGQGMLKGRAWFLLTGHPSGLTREMLTVERGLFDLQLELKPLNPETTYEMLINYLNSARIDNECTDPNDPRSVLPFEPDAACRFCQVSGGHPRRFNRFGNIVLNTAQDMNASRVTMEVLNRGLAIANHRLRGQVSIAVHEQLLLNLLLEKGFLSDESISFDDLERLGVRTFSELLPTLDKFEQNDLIRRLPGDRATAYEPLDLPLEDIEE